MITIKEVTTKVERKKFVLFPMKLFRKSKQYVPTLIADEMSMFDPHTNDAYSYAECKLFLAYRGKRIVGRIGCILNRAYNEKANVRQMRFTRLDFEDDEEISGALFAAAETYARERGMDELVGPMGFSDLDKQGLLVDHFELTPQYIEIYNAPYYVRHLEKLGFAKIIDWVEHKLETPSKVDERLDSLCDKVEQKYGLRTLTFGSMKEMNPYFMPALDVMNEVYYRLFGTVKLTPKQLEAHAKSMKVITVPQLPVVVVNSEDKVIAYGFMAPSLSRGMQKAKGRMLPFGIFHIIKALTKFDTIDFYSIGVLPEYQKVGVSALILRAGIYNANKLGVKYAETGPMLETNLAVQSQWRAFKKVNERRRRCYGKKI